MTQTIYSHGKLLLTSEYLVLDGALALALPTKKGQLLGIKMIKTSELRWKSLLEDKSTWFETKFTLPLQEQIISEDPIIKKLFEILKAAQKLNRDFLNNGQGYEVTSTLEFAQNWGLGSSSTLISNIARWTSVDPYELLKMTFGGSGYDIACATTNSPLLYTNEAQPPIVKEISFNPMFKDQLFFIHLNKKQNSRESIIHYRSLDPTTLKNEATTFSKLTLDIQASYSLDHFQTLLNQHEDRLSKILKTPTIKAQLFSDYPNTIKSLGGWGGDFILAIGDIQQMSYFKNKGYTTIVSYEDMILR